jgi:nitroreductase
LGIIARDLYHRRNADARGPQEAAERNRFLRAPVVVAVVARLQDHPKIPEWEQVLSSGACCINMLNAAYALGFAAQWLTEWCAYDADFREALGLESRERIAGFIYMGTAPSAPVERQRPEVDSLVTYWSAGTAAP